MERPTADLPVILSFGTFEYVWRKLRFPSRSITRKFLRGGRVFGKKYTKKHEVSYYECDINQTMTFPSMLGVVIKTSEDQSDQLGRGSEFVNSFGLTWVITNYSMEINRLP